MNNDKLTKEVLIYCILKILLAFPTKFPTYFLSIYMYIYVYIHATYLSNHRVNILTQ